MSSYSCAPLIKILSTEQLRCPRPKTKKASKKLHFSALKGPIAKFAKNQFISIQAPIRALTWFALAYILWVAEGHKSRSS